MYPVTLTTPVPQDQDQRTQDQDEDQDFSITVCISEQHIENVLDRFVSNFFYSLSTYYRWDKSIRV